MGILEAWLTCFYFSSSSGVATSWYFFFAIVLLLVPHFDEKHTWPRSKAAHAVRVRVAGTFFFLVLYSPIYAMRLWRLLLPVLPGRAIR